MKRQPSKRPIRKKRALIAVLLAALLVGGGVLVFRHFHKPVPKLTAKAGDDSHINYGPPTAEEKAQAQAHKEDLSQQYQQEQNPPPPTSGKKQVTPVITTASQSGQQITITALMNGIFENDGNCVATITQGSQKITKTGQALANASTTDCAPFFINRSEFPAAGDWQVTIKYDSATSTGVSQSKTLAIQ